MKTTTVGDLLGEREPVMVGVEAKLAEVAERLIESRHSSVVVVDDDGRPLGRILADDVVDALDARAGAPPLPAAAVVSVQGMAPSSDEVVTPSPALEGSGGRRRPPAPAAGGGVAHLPAPAGPGLIAANAGNDAGGIVTYASPAPSSSTGRCSSCSWSPSPWSWSRRCAPGSARTPAKAWPP